MTSKTDQEIKDDKNIFELSRKIIDLINENPTPGYISHEALLLTLASSFSCYCEHRDLEKVRMQLKKNTTLILDMLSREGFE